MPSDTAPNAFENKSGSGEPKSGASGKTGAARPEADLESQIAKLREDVAGVADALKGLANERADSARKHAFALRDDVKDRGERYIRQAQDAASEIEEQLSERVRAEPIKSVLIAAAVGYLYARIFKR